MSPWIVPARLPRSSPRRSTRSTPEAGRPNLRNVCRSMGAGASPRFAIVSIVVFTLSVCLGLPFEDVLDVAYDEKETQPFESTGLFSSAMLQVLDRALRSGTNFDCPLQSGCLKQVLRTLCRAEQGSRHPRFLDRPRSPTSLLGPSQPIAKRNLDQKNFGRLGADHEP